MIYLYILLTLILSGFFSGSEIAFLSSDKLRLEIDKSKGQISAKILSHFYKSPDFFITTMLLGNNVVLVLYGLLMASVFEPILRQWMQEDVLVLLCQSIIATILILFTGEFLPKVIFRQNPNSLLRALSLPLLLVYLLLYPFTYLINLITKLVLRMAGQKNPSMAGISTISTIDLEHYLESNHRDDGNSDMETEVKIIQNAISFPTLQVRDCMRPRNEIVGVEIDAPIEVLQEQFVRTGLSKLIVYRTHIDEVVGYIHSSEMFHDRPWQEGILPALFVPESMYARKLMTQLMAQGRSVAIVIDELGGTSGLVTLEDVVEEIFGDIEDEHDHQRRVAKQIDEKTYLFSGRMEIDDVNERFSLDLPEDEDFMTIAGFILHHHPRLPSQGEIIEIDALRFEVIRATPTRIVLVKLYLP